MAGTGHGDVEEAERFNDGGLAGLLAHFDVGFAENPNRHLVGGATEFVRDLPRVLTGREQLR